MTYCPLADKVVCSVPEAERNCARCLDEQVKELFEKFDRTGDV